MFALDIFLQDYKGFYVENTEDSTGVYLQYRDAKALHAGAQLYYIFSPDRYTMASAFQQTAKQTESAGSWVLSTYLNGFDLTTGNYTANSLSNLAATYQAFTLNSTNAGVAGGYGYSLRSASGAWYLSGQLLLGFGYQLRRFKYAGSASQESTGSGSKVTFHFGAGWTGERNAAGLIAVSDNTGFSDKTADVNSLRSVTSTATTGRLFYMYRF
jgi:hypothetical protein